MSLDLDDSYFADHYTEEPLCLFRIFNYPPSSEKQTHEPQWGVGEHTDYGVLTCSNRMIQEACKSKVRKMVGCTVIPNAFVCNIGDMLDRLTKGYYRSTPHRVLNKSGHGRLSYPFFFDPNMNAEIHPLLFLI